jgi:hypothetical protein
MFAMLLFCPISQQNTRENNNDVALSAIATAPERKQNNRESTVP